MRLTAGISYSLLILMMISCGSMRHGNFNKRKYLKLDAKESFDVGDEETVLDEQPEFRYDSDELEIPDPQELSIGIESEEVDLISDNEAYYQEHFESEEIEFEPYDSLDLKEENDTISDPVINRYASNGMKYTRRTTAMAVLFGICAVGLILTLVLGGLLYSVNAGTALALTAAALTTFWLGFIFSLLGFVQTGKWVKALQRKGANEEQLEEPKRWKKKATIYWWSFVGLAAVGGLSAFIAFFWWSFF